MANTQVQYKNKDLLAFADKTFIIVQEGLEILGKYDMQWYAVTNENAIILDHIIYCTQTWKCNLDECLSKLKS